MNQQVVALTVAIGSIIMLSITTFVFYRKSRKLKETQLKLKKHRLQTRFENDHRIFSELTMKQSIPDSIHARKKEDIIIMHELQLGESLMSSGNYEEGTKHLANAVSLYSNPEKFLRTLKGCLEPFVYKMLLDTLVLGTGLRGNYDPFDKYAFQNSSYCFYK